MIDLVKIKTRKPHMCCTCGKTIPAGEWVNFFESRQPKLNEEDIQIGISYFKLWCHLPPEEGEYDCWELTNSGTIARDPTH